MPFTGYLAGKAKKSNQYKSSCEDGGRAPQQGFHNLQKGFLNAQALLSSCHIWHHAAGSSITSARRLSVSTVCRRAVAGGWWWNSTAMPVSSCVAQQESVLRCVTRFLMREHLRGEMMVLAQPRIALSTAATGHLHAELHSRLPYCVHICNACNALLAVILIQGHWTHSRHAHPCLE